MKKKIIKAILIWASVILVLRMQKTWDFRQYRYYKETKNFISLTVEVEDFYYVAGEGRRIEAYYLVTTSKPTGFSDRTFVIEGRNAELVRLTGAEQKISRGSLIEIISAPRYFYDGYDMPIAGMTIQNDDVLLFPTGYENLQNQLRKPIQRFWLAVYIVLLVMMAQCIIVVVRYRRKA